MSTRLSVVAISGLLLGGAALEHQSRRNLRHQAHYLSVAQEIEDTYRSALMRPTHDIRPDRAAIRRGQKTLHGDLERLGTGAAAPIHYALGVGYWTLRELPNARTHLEQAWELGLREPRLALVLGRVHARLYRRGQAEIGPPTTPRRRELLAELEARHRRPAARFLNIARQRPSITTPVIESRLAWIEESFDDALKSARQVRHQAPWQHEHLLLEAEILLDHAESIAGSSDLDRATEMLQQARTLLETARTTAPSDPQVPLTICRLAESWIDIYNKRRPATDRALQTQLYEFGVKACRDALRVDPDLADAWMRLSDLHGSWAYAGVWFGDDTDALRAAALESIHRALELSPNAWRYRERFVTEILDMSNIRIAEHPDEDEFLPLLEQGFEVVQGMIRERPQSSVAHHLLGSFYYVKSHYLLQTDKDRVDEWLAGAAAMGKAAELDPNEPIYALNLGLLYYHFLYSVATAPVSNQPVEGWLEAGLQATRAATELSPHVGWGYSVRGWLEGLRGRLDFASAQRPLDAELDGVEHHYRALQTSPQTPLYATTLIENLIESAERHLLFGYEPSPLTDEARRLLAAQHDLLGPEVASRLDLELDLLDVLGLSVVGRPAEPAALAQEVPGKNPSSLAQRLFTHRRLLCFALQESRQGRLEPDTVDRLTDSVEALPSGERWRLGLVATLEAHATAETVHREWQVERAAAFLAPDQVPWIHLKTVEPWREAVLRLPPSGTRPFRLFNNLKPSDHTTHVLRSATRRGTEIRPEAEKETRDASNS